ncbi:patatin [Paraburkholderia sp. UCT2]|uniref:patatin n=1 Tax=Paraburkholderia sp. UCT2 TaxID=2615208 RepID=UPI0016555BED|nr:patatin [Paraburkholderia sp. UCT2]
MMRFLIFERRATTLIAAITVLTGAAQVIASSSLLALIAYAPPDRLADHLFATVGMFMMLFGGSLLHAQRRTEALGVVLLWGALQKLLASAFVAWGVTRGVFISAALLVAIFDGASGLLYLDLRRRGG